MTQGDLAWHGTPPKGARSGDEAAGGRPSTSACGEQVCITCSDAAVEARVVELRAGGLAVVEPGSATQGAEREVVSVALVDVEAGDLVLVHAKEAIARLDRPGDR